MTVTRPTKLDVAIVDYGMGNLFSVKHASEYVGLGARITAEKADILGASAVILPGVGAFGDAMAALKRLDLVGPLQEIGRSGKPLIGICLGLQLLMTESYEFGRHRGLDLIEGPVVRLRNAAGGHAKVKVPQVGWNRVFRPEPSGDASQAGELPVTDDPWRGTFMEALPDGEYMYFVHSFYVEPRDQQVMLSTTCYGDQVFCSGIRSGGIFGTQFHPERSGPQGLRIYKRLANLIHTRDQGAQRSDV